MGDLNSKRRKIYIQLAQHRIKYGPLPADDEWEAVYEPEEKKKLKPDSTSPLPSKLKFRGDFQSLRKIVRRTGVEGEWSRSGTARVYRTEDGAVMNWAETTGAIWFQGKEPFSKRLGRAVLSQLGS